MTFLMLYNIIFAVYLNVIESYKNYDYSDDVFFYLA